MARLPPFTGGEESVTLTLPASVAAAALTALKQDTIDYNELATRAWRWPRLIAYWHRRGEENERIADLFARAMAGRL